MLRNMPWLHTYTQIHDNWKILIMSRDAYKFSQVPYRLVPGKIKILRLEVSLSS